MSYQAKGAIPIKERHPAGKIIMPSVSIHLSRRRSLNSRITALVSPGQPSVLAKGSGWILRFASSPKTRNSPLTTGNDISPKTA